MTTKTKEVKKNNDPKFTKDQLLKSNRFKFKQDILNVLLEDGKSYTIKTVDDKIKKYEQKEV